MAYDDVLTRNEEQELAVRVVSATEQSSVVNPNDVFTRDTDGNLCIRTTGSGGGSVDENKVIVLSDTIPEANADSLGKFYCYKGTTNSSYTHGYIYECVAGSAYYEANIAFDKSTFASEDFYKAGKLIVDAGVADPEEVTGGTMTYALAGNLWSIVFTDANGDALNTAYSIYTDDLEQDYDILPVIDPSEFVDGQVVGMIINNVIEHHDYSWERVDVQPAAKLGRYLSGWNCVTGLAMTNPQENPYEYTTGDYFIVGIVATGGATNYKPNGSSYTIGVASTTVESETVNVNDTYLYDGTSWTLLKTGSAVTSVNGQTGDVTVQEQLVSGTNIKTINNNSLLGSGNITIEAGIDWATSVDLPANFQWSSDCFPIYTVTGGLPDGTYEFFWQIKCGYGPDYPIGRVTYKAIITIDNANMNAFGWFAPVIDGEWLPDMSDLYTPRSAYLYIAKKNGSDLILYSTENEWRTDIGQTYSPVPAVAECFKISKIKNISTGTEYIPTGVLYDPANPPSYNDFNGYIHMSPLAIMPSIPNYNTQAQNISYTSSNRYFRLSYSGYISISENGTIGNISEFDFSAETGTGGKFHIIIENIVGGYIAKVLEATGDLANAQVGYDDQGGLFFDFNSAGNSGEISLMTGVKGPNTYYPAPYQELLSYDVTITPLVLSNVGSTVSMDNYGRIDQYTGITNANYTNGYFYKATGTITLVPSDIEFRDLPSGVTLTISDTDDFISACATEYGSSAQTFIDQVLNGWRTWNLSVDVNGNITSVAIYGDWVTFESTSSSVLQYLSTNTADRTFSPQGLYVPAHDEITNGHWEQIDVQPAGATIDDTSISSLTATWSANKLNAVLGNVETLLSQI